MNWLDLVIIVLLIIFTFSGLASGFVRSAFATAGVIVGVVLASHFDNWAKFISNVDTAHIVAFIIVLLVVIIIANYRQSNSFKNNFNDIARVVKPFAWCGFRTSFWWFHNWWFVDNLGQIWRG